MQIAIQRNSRDIGTVIRDVVLQNKVVGFAMDTDYIVLADSRHIDFLPLRLATKEDIHYLINNSRPIKAVFDRKSVLRDLRNYYEGLSCHSFVDVESLANERGASHLLASFYNKLKDVSKYLYDRVSRALYSYARPRNDREARELDTLRPYLIDLAAEALYAYNLYNDIQAVSPDPQVVPPPRFPSVCLFRIINQVNTLLSYYGSMEENELLEMLDEDEKMCPTVRPARGITSEMFDFMSAYGFVESESTDDGVIIKL